VDAAGDDHPTVNVALDVHAALESPRECIADGGFARGRDPGDEENGGPVDVSL
jgi:hypothetical protein